MVAAFLTYTLSRATGELQILGKVFATVKVEQYDRAFGENKCIPGRIVKCPNLHVPRARRIPNVNGIEKQTCAVIALLELLTDSVEAVGAHSGHVDSNLIVILGQSSGLPCEVVLLVSRR